MLLVDVVIVWLHIPACQREGIQQLINLRELGVSSKYYSSSPCPGVQPAECVAVWPLNGDLDLGQMFDPTLALVIWWNPHLPTSELHPLEPGLVLVPIVEVPEKPHTLKHKRNI